MIAILCISIILAIRYGSVSINLKSMSSIERDILLQVRIPRVVLAGLVGAALSISGVLFQYVMKNPLADSFTTGVSATSAMGAVIAIVSGLGNLIPLFAIVSGIAGLLMVYKIASVKGQIQPITMLLAGIILSTFSSAIISMIKYLNEESLGSIIFWLMGGFQAATPLRVIVLLIVLSVSLFLLRKEFLKLDILCFDDTTAQSSGVNVTILRKKLFFMAALLTAFSVSYAGIIGFVGLITPHLLRLMGFIKAKDLIPASIIGGAIFMIITDMLSRTILPQGQEMPVGILTSSLGGIFFLYLLSSRKKELYYFD